MASIINIYSYPSDEGDKRLTAIAGRGVSFKKKDEAAVSKIITDVRKRGDAALVEYIRKFDSPEFSKAKLKVTQEEFHSAKASVDRSFVRTLNRAIEQIESFHRRQAEQSWFTTEREGTFLGQMVNPVDAAGVYVPGGKEGQTPLVSSVLMGAIPAKVAGVPRIAMVTPPMKNGAVNPYLLAAAAKLGIKDVYKMGSAWAIAALAYGTETVPGVDVIVGPGNIWVTIAKKLVSGTVGIDMIAGPSEILVLADKTAEPEFVAADMLSQAEHDVLASAVMITDSAGLATSVVSALGRQLGELERKEIAGVSLDRYGAVFVTPDMETAVALANRVAPEHLELQVADPFAWVGKIRNAGAVFMGRYTPEPVGDYIAGPNHVLPTAGTARFSSALSVSHFTKKTSVLQYSRDAFRREAKDVMRLADIEGLGAHLNAVNIRLKR